MFKQHDSAVGYAVLRVPGSGHRRAKGQLRRGTAITAQASTGRYTAAAECTGFHNCRSAAHTLEPAADSSTAAGSRSGRPLHQESLTTLPISWPHGSKSCGTSSRENRGGTLGELCGSVKPGEKTTMGPPLSPPLPPGEGRGGLRKILIWEGRSVFFRNEVFVPLEGICGSFSDGFERRSVRCTRAPFPSC